MERELAQSEIRGVGVEIDGRQVRLSGFATAEDQQRSQEIAESLSGIRDATYAMIEPSPGAIEVTVSDAGVRVESLGANQRHVDLVEEAMVEAALAGAIEAAAAGPVTIDAQWKPGIELDATTTVILHDVLLASVGDLDDATITIRGNAVAVEGLATDDEAVLRVEALEGVFGSDDLLVHVNVEPAALSLDAEVLALVAEFDALSKEIRDAGVPLFETDADVLTTKGQEVGDRVIAAMSQYQLPLVEAVGHTDDVGDAEYNQELSTRRSASLMAYIIADGIDAERMWSNGAGETQPVGDNTLEVGRQANRRVEFRVHTERPADTSTPSTQSTPGLDLGNGETTEQGATQ